MLINWKILQWQKASDSLPRVQVGINLDPRGRREAEKSFLGYIPPKLINFNAAN